MNIFYSIFYGIVQGITEFLPISSTAHLTLFSKLFGMPECPESFAVALHLGTAIAVILFFLKDWISLISSGIKAPTSKTGRLFWLLVVATIPAGIVGLVFNGLEPNMLIIGIALIVLGVLLYIVDKNSANKVKTIEGVRPKTGILIGISQCLAIIPGVSRSGITITAGRALGVSRSVAARFTFLLSAPIILADGLYHLVSGGMGQVVTEIGMLNFFIGIITSAIVGALVIKLLLDLLKTKGFGGFAIYRVVLGIIVIIAFFIK